MHVLFVLLCHHADDSLWSTTVLAFVFLMDKLQCWITYMKLMKLDCLEDASQAIRLLAVSFVFITVVFVCILQRIYRIIVVLHLFFPLSVGVEHQRWHPDNGGKGSSPSLNPDPSSVVVSSPAGTTNTEVNPGGWHPARMLRDLFCGKGAQQTCNCSPMSMSSCLWLHSRPPPCWKALCEICNRPLFVLMEIQKPLQWNTVLLQCFMIAAVNGPSPWICYVGIDVSLQQG